MFPHSKYKCEKVSTARFLRFGIEQVNVNVAREAVDVGLEPGEAKTPGAQMIRLIGGEETLSDQ